MDDKLSLTPVARLRAPIGGQEIELQQLDWAVGGMSLLRVRIREGRRFTVFDIDAATAAAWGDAMRQWSANQPGANRPAAPTPAAERPDPAP
jgi:Family of unknown function (DUF6967)